MIEFQKINQALLSHGYEYIETIGLGSSCSVCLCKSEKYHQTFAIKILSNNTLQASEYNALISLHHPYIIKLYESFEDNNSEYLVMEYCPNETLKQKEKLSYDKFIYYAKQILEALSYCHSNKIAHRDIKPENIFLDQYDRVKLADFGLSKYFEPNIVSEEKCGSIMYCAPEMLKRLPFDPFQADIWALGITFFYMATGKFPYPKMPSDQLLKIVKLGYIDFVNVEINPDIKSLIQKMTNKTPKLRPSVDEILNMPIFNQLKAQKIKKTFSSAQFGSRATYKRNKSFLIKPSSSFTNDADEDSNNENGNRISLARSKTYKSSITHSSIFRMNPSFESQISSSFE